MYVPINEKKRYLKCEALPNDIKQNTELTHNLLSSQKYREILYYFFSSTFISKLVFDEEYVHA